LGTRNLTAVIKDGDYKVAQYGQWDGYPEGQGATVYEFLRGEGNLDKLTRNLDKVRWATDADFAKANEAIGSKDNGWITMEQGMKLNEMFPELSRDTCAEILSLVANTERELALTDERAFLDDSLFCEWAYVVDLDTNELRVYTDGNKTLMATFPLNALPDTEDEYFRLCHKH
jgi:hypothetical protein